jgi:hypothetical protein
MQRPSGVTLTAALMAVLTIVSVVAVFTMPLPPLPTSSAVSTSLIGTMARGGGIFAAVISAVFIFLYWKGFSWMRWVVMIYSIFPIIGLKAALALYPLSGIASIVSALLGVFLIWYLNTAPVKAWFESPKTEATA